MTLKLCGWLNHLYVELTLWGMPTRSKSDQYLLALEGLNEIPSIPQSPELRRAWLVEEQFRQDVPEAAARLDGRSCRQGLALHEGLRGSIPARRLRGRYPVLGSVWQRHLRDPLSRHHAA